MTDPIAVQFGPGARRLFGVFHPARAPLRAGLLICPPLLHEQVRSYRLFSGIADLFARSGVACLRFDYHGTGDSSGETTDFRPARVGADIALATAELRARQPDAPLVLMGVRGGALFAGMYAGQVEARCLWLWQPVLDAAAYLHELDALDAAERGSRLRYPFRRSGPGAERNELVGFALCEGFRDELAACSTQRFAPDMATTVIDAAAAVPPGDLAVTRLVLPDTATAWTGQVEMEGVVPVRAARQAVEALAATLGGA